MSKISQETVVIIDFGGQYNQLIARRVREHNIYCEVLPYKTSVDVIKGKNPKAIIFTGGPNSVYAENAPLIDKQIFELGLPILGICYGVQLMCHLLGGSVVKAKDSSLSEYGKATFNAEKSVLFDGVDANSVAWMSHNDYITELPQGFSVIGTTEKCPYAAIENVDAQLYGVQFHPEVNHTQFGFNILGNFLKKIAKLNGDWTMEEYAEIAVKNIREQVAGGKVLLALSGGVDSSVACALLSKAVGDQLTCIFVDHGFMRKNEGDEVEKAFADWDINFIRVNAD